MYLKKFQPDISEELWHFPLSLTISYGSSHLLTDNSSFPPDHIIPTSRNPFGKIYLPSTTIKLPIFNSIRKLYVILLTDDWNRVTDTTSQFGGDQCSPDVGLLYGHTSDGEYENKEG
ncbi:hypothetical protein CEXT_405021 [Caerostris extrusa]|uniref:Uncharacterized protein n=1 Tax=Caerostris extrusa TaxID=172846 RepID=A0AAV4V957_CAEEX|nr:hypothetical protein CEXT_405021 [Caerostris extrusa]